MKEHSAGLLIKTRKGYLACHPTMQPKAGPHWDIPKGHIETGEDAAAAMLRELREETGLDGAKWNIRDCGVIPYIATKDIHMFYTEVDQIDLTKLKCSSYHRINNRDIPEMNDYMLTDDFSCYFPKLQKTLQKTLEQLQD